jgi:hypothetical protein
MRLRKDDENRLALRQRDESGHLTNLRDDRVAQRQGRKEPGGGGGDQGGGDEENADDPDRSPHAFARRPRLSGSERRHFDHGRQMPFRQFRPRVGAR